MLSENALDERVAVLAERWDLALEPVFPLTPGSRGNFVAPARRRSDGTSCVLKVTVFVGSTPEAAALTAWNGHGAVRLLEAEPDLGGLLLERIEPGDMLAEVAQVDDDAATRIAAGLLRTLWRPAEAAH